MTRGPFRCDRCGETWTHHPVLAVPCPDCGAERGIWCKRPSGHRAWGDLHVSREQAALDEGVLRRCGEAVSAINTNPNRSTR